MIVSVILNLFYSIVNFFANRLPTTGIPTDVTSGVTNFFNFVYDYNSLLPVNTIFYILGLTVVFWAIILGWDFFKWLIHLGRGN